MAEEIDIGMKCIKYMLFVANCMFVMIGFLLILIGTTIKAIYGYFEAFMADHYFSPAILAVVIGVIIFFVAIFGCVGAVKESTCLINLFGVFLAVLLIMEISAAIAAYAMRSRISETIGKKMTESIQGSCYDDYDEMIWDFTQRRLMCCGIEGPSDWNKFCPPTAAPSTSAGTTSSDGVAVIPSANLTAASGVPSSCCRRFDLNEQDQCPSNKIFRDGCLDVLSYVVSDSSLLLGCGTLAVAFIQLLGIIFAWMLAQAVRRLKTKELVEKELNRQKNYEQMAKGEDEKVTPVLYTPTFTEA